METVREFSAVGPCISLGELLKTTAASVFYRDRHGNTVRVGGQRVADGLVHTSACRSCRDHAETQYAEGYQG